MEEITEENIQKWTKEELLAVYSSKLKELEREADSRLNEFALVKKELAELGKKYVELGKKYEEKYAKLSKEYDELSQNLALSNSDNKMHATKYDELMKQVEELIAAEEERKQQS